MNENIDAHRYNSELRREIAQLRGSLTAYSNLIAWLAPRIQRRNGNGAVSDRFCLLCVLGQPQYKRLPCRHDEIFTLATPTDSSVHEDRPA